MGRMSLLCAAAVLAWVLFLLATGFWKWWKSLPERRRDIVICSLGLALCIGIIVAYWVYTGGVYMEIPPPSR